MRVWIALPLALCAACASVVEPARPPGPPPFEGVRSIALVRLVDDPSGRRAKDALDALGESLGERGYRTRLLEVDPRNPDQRGVERLFARIHTRIATGAERVRASRGSGRGEEDAAAVLAALGVDAAAMVHRFDAVLPPPPAASPFAPTPPGSMFDPPGAEWQQYRIVGALSLVSRAGYVVWFDWGTPTPSDPDVPANAAEAVDALLAVLAGQDADEP